jgi:diguanylate cyclase (GGDEF)-like protein/PAS domain S-box-containing protein
MAGAGGGRRWVQRLIRLDRRVPAVDISTMEDGDTDVEVRQRWLTDLLSAHAGARVGVVSTEGRFCTLPSALDLGSGPRLEARTGLDLVERRFRPAMVDHFQRVRQHGVATVRVRTIDGAPVVYAGIDLRDAHGVIVLVEVPDLDDGELRVDMPEEQAVSSRFGRQWRDEVAIVRDMDDACARLLGFTIDELVDQNPLDFIHPDDHEVALANWHEVLVAPPGVPRRWRGRHRRKDGSWIWLECTNYSRIDEAEGDVLTEMMDISDEMAAVEALRHQNELLEQLAEALPLGVLQINRDRTIVYANDRLPEVIGDHPSETVDELMSSVVDEDGPRLAAAVEDVLSTGAPADLELRLTGPDRSRRFCTVSVRALRDRDDITGAVFCIADVTEGTLMRRELERRATFDPLTRCYNRASIMNELERTTEAATQSEVGTVVLFIDLNKLKPVNDELGHAAGDQLLVRFADRLRASVRTSDTVGRVGGDEFLVVCPGVTGAEQAKAIAQRVSGGLTGRDVVCGRTVDVSASIGVVWSTAVDATAEALVAMADEAMYEAKRLADGQPVYVWHTTTAPTAA